MLSSRDKKAKIAMKRYLYIALLMALLPSATCADVALSRLFSDHMVLQRGGPVHIYGQASPGEQVTVRFHGQTGEATASASGEWTTTLKAMDADRVGQTLTVTGKNTLHVEDVLIGDVWLCSGQSNMAFGLGGCDRPSDIASADLPGVRQFAVPLVFSGVPTRALQGNWAVCSPRTASGFSATAFYFARKIYQEMRGTVPIGLIVSSVGGTRIDLWLAPDGVVDIPVLHPLLSQNPLPSGPFSLFNGMIYPLAPYGIRGVLWYQGENSELTAQSRDSYYLKMKALVQGWKRLWGVDDLAYYFVQLANWGEIPRTSTPEILPGRGWDADTRLQQVNAMSLPHSGMASALDIGESLDMHPKDKLDLGERLALWALKNEYGRSNLLASGPVLRDIAVSGATAVCSFDQAGSGLMVGAKTPYQPTREVPGGTLERFVIAGTDGVWHPAQATIRGDKIVLASPDVKVPHSVSYAFWQNPVGCNLYNREGLPASPFLVEDVTLHHTIKATAGRGGKISRPGLSSLLPRSTALYTITPEPGHYVEDVQVDGVSVGAVRSYTFDPIYADHTLTATFTRSAPRYTLTVKCGGGGTLTPATSLTLPQGGAVSLDIRPDGDNLMTVRVDGVSLGQRSRIAFSDLRANHTLEVTFSGTIRALAGYGGTVSGDGLTPVPYGTDRTFTITPIPGYAISHVLADGKEVGAVSSYTFPNVTRSHTLLATFQHARKDLDGREMSVPQSEQLLFACLRESLPASGTGNASPIPSWPAYLPAGRTLRAQGEPQLETIGGQRFARIVYEKGQGFTFGTYTAPIPCQGASIVLVAKPIRNGASTGWTSLVDVFYDRLVFGIRNDNGALCVRRNGSIEQSTTPIPDGQITILSLIVQPDGTYKAWANGVEVMSNNTKNPLSALTSGVAGPFATSITIGRNAPDGWTTFNGNIGDVFLYKTALTDPERRQLESYLATKLLKANDH